MEPDRGKSETNPSMRGSESGLRRGPFGISGTIVIGAAGAPIGNWPLIFEVCSLIVVVTSGGITVVPTRPGAVPLEISQSFGEIED